MKRSYLSGAQKRRDKKKKFEESVKISQSLSSWLAANSRTDHPSQNCTPEEDCDTRSEDSAEPLMSQDIDKNVCRTETTVCYAGTSSGRASSKAYSLAPISENKIEQSSGSPQVKPSLSSEESDTSSSSEDDETENEDLHGFKKPQLLGCFISPNENDSIELKRSFIEKHPIQTFDRNGIKLPFESSKLYYRTLENGEKIQRKWLSYSTDLNKIFCCFCMAFGDKDHRNSSFVTGHDVSVKHIYKSVEIHENSQTHKLAVTAALQSQKERDIETLLSSNQAKRRQQEIQTRRQILERIIDIVLFIGRQGIAYRGKKIEGAHSIETEENHGNFLELVKLVANYDVILQSHVKKCIKNSKINRSRIMRKRESQGKSKKGQIGRGSLLTFMSKSFINKLINVIATLGRNIILKDLRDSVLFSLMVDSTQDVAVMDQLAICVRYSVEGHIYERLLNIQVVDDSSGLALYELIKAELTKFGIEMSHIIACSFDGANNMKGCYNGLQAHFKRDNPQIIYTHCMGHVLNLVVADSTVKILQAENLFGLVEESAVFLSSSYKRMTVWENETKKKHKAHEKLYRLQKIGATRWWSKHKALSSIIDEEFLRNEDSSGKLIHFLNVLLEISNGSFDPKTKFVARSLVEHWSKFENIFLAFSLLDIFFVTSPVSKYLQAKDIDYSKAWNLISNLLKQITNKRSDERFQFLYDKTKEYTKKTQSYFEDKDVLIELDFVEKKRKLTKKRMDGEKSKDEAAGISSLNAFKHVYFNILDRARNSIQERFSPNEKLLDACSWLDPKRFNEMKKDSFQFQPHTLNSISEVIKIDKTLLLMELKQFADLYHSFIPPSLVTKNEETESKQTMEELGSEFEEEKDEDDQNNSECEEEMIPKCSGNGRCFKCLSCAFYVVHDLSQSGLFLNLYQAYKYVITLPSTQVTCERVFSKLKIVKNRLRANLNQDLMADLLLMNVERDLFLNLNKNEIIDNVAESSLELKNNLLGGLGI